MRLVKETNYVELGPRDRIAHVSNVCFDAATFEVWGALLTGGCAVVISKSVALDPREFALELKRQKVNTLFLTTALFNELARNDGGIFGSLKQVLFGGEAANPHWVRHVLENGPPERLLHVYGPTECTTFATYYEVREVPRDATTIPIGKPISNTTAYILDRHGNPVPVGVPGELYLGGEGLADGYLNQTDLTREKFLPDPFDPAPNRRLYRTGDIVKYLADGNIEFVTRLDDQVKIRGFRIELQEVANVLQRHSGIARAVATVWEPAPGEEQLIAHYVAKDRRSAEPADLFKFLGSQLPAYMVPSALIEVEELPIIPTGKINSRALPKPDRDSFRPGETGPEPRDATEQQLLAIWKRLLQIEGIGVHDNFFQLGGHSLLALRLLDDVNQRFRLQLPIRTLFADPTIAGLAHEIRDALAKNSSSVTYPPLVPLRPGGRRSPFFLAAGGFGGEAELLVYAKLARRLDHDLPIYGLRARGVDELVEPHESVEAMAAEHLACIRQIQPSGPYFIGGSCVGGIVALEIAQQLCAAGEEVARLIVIDSQFPSRSGLARYGLHVWRDELRPIIQRCRERPGDYFKAINEQMRLRFAPSEEQKIGQQKVRIGRTYLRRFLKYSPRPASEGLISREIGVLKIDTEGCDLNVLRGMGDVRAEVLVCEFVTPSLYSTWSRSFPEPLVHAARKKGYQACVAVKRMAGHELVVFDPQGFVDGQWGNLVFTGRELLDLARDEVGRIAFKSETALANMIRRHAEALEAKEAAIRELTAACEAKEAVIRELAAACEARLDAINKLTAEVERLKRNGRV